MNHTVNVGFIGNPNCGKTTLFNAYTGANLKVANWPGVTVEKKKDRQPTRAKLLNSSTFRAFTASLPTQWKKPSQGNVL